jgi:hypothetical protein
MFVESNSNDLIDTLLLLPTNLTARGRVPFELLAFRA